MCNLYSITKSQREIIQFTRAMRDTTGNLPPMPGVFPTIWHRSCATRRTAGANWQGGAGHAVVAVCLDGGDQEACGQA
jgi:hypothetical protein